VIISSFSLLILFVCALVIVMLRKGASSIGHLFYPLAAWENWQRSAPVALWRNSKQEVVAAGGEVILHLREAARASA